MRKKVIIIFLILGMLITIIALLLLQKNNITNKKNSLTIIDATSNCFSTLERFHEDNNYIYYFPCKKSDSVYVKLPNGTKMLVVDALGEEKVTIEELIRAGLEVKKKKK